ncbi:MAG TPA: 6-pyruvoyl-tetrahydropterin synthase-related protein [Candidatus Baltobacteraceae bacterium]|nr:6-pyruvoyl-tetrahydropterin synthase-related protein [Candidatus Baltobacteraceae bacterium]
MAVATAVIAPMPFLDNASGHDFQFHLSSWMETASQWREGILYPRWAEWANWGFGEPRFIFYPPASWMIGAGMGLVLPWRVVPGAFIWLALIAAGMSMSKLAREWLDGPQATVAAVLYAVSPYQLVMVYYRSDFAELLAGALFPLVLWGAVRISRGDWRAVPWLALIFAGIWISNAPAAVMATYSLTLAIAVGCVVRRSLRPLFPGAIAMAGGFGLAAFYILPAAWEQRWVQIGQVLADHFRPWQNFLFTHNNAPDFTQFNWRVSWVALGAIVVTIVAAAFAARRRRESPDLWWIVAATEGAALFLMLPPSTLLWRYLPRLQFMQFPWRWLEALGVAYALFLAAGMGRLRRNAWIVPMIMLVATAGTACALIHTGWWDSDDVPAVADAIHLGHGYEGTDEYMPIGADRDQLPGNPDEDTRPEGVSGETAPRIAMVDAENSDEIVPVTGARIHIERWTAERRIIAVEDAQPIRLAPRLLAYPAWKVKVDGRDAPYEISPDTSQMIVLLPSGTHRIEIRFSRTWDRTTGGALSLATAALLLLATALQRRAANDRL